MQWDSCEHQLNGGHTDMYLTLGTQGVAVVANMSTTIIGHEDEYTEAASSIESAQ